jgi:hypothetical protein
LKYGSVPGVEKPVARIVQGTVMIRSEEEGEEERSFPLLDEVLVQGGTTGAEFEAGAVELSPEELAWLESGERPEEGGRTSSA